MAWIPEPGSGGVSDHGDLDGLADDDHTQYLNTARHAAIDAADHGSGAATAGQVLTADGAGGAAWKDPTGGRAFAETIGDNSNTSFQVQHNLGTQDLVVQLWDLTGAEPIEATGDASQIKIDDDNNITVTFSAAPATDSYRVVILASGGSTGGGGGPAAQTVTFSAEGEAEVGMGASRFVAPRAGTIIQVRAAAGDPPVGDSIVVDVNKNGTTIFTTQANRPTVPDGEYIGNEVTPNVTSIAEGDWFTVDIDQVGSTNPGGDITVMIEVEWEPI